MISMRLIVLFFLLVSQSLHQVICLQSRTLFHLERVWKNGESLIDHSSNETSRTARADPLNGLKKYRGGYDIENKHYWASAVFTGIYGYAIAMAVFLLGLALFLLTLVHLSKRSEWKRWEKITSTLSNSHYVLFTVALVVATILALAFCCTILAGNHMLNKEAKNVEAIIIGAANNATATIHNITSVMADISSMLRPFDGNLTGNSTPTAVLFSSRAKLSSEAIRIQDKVSKNQKLIDKRLKEIYVTVIVTSCSTMLVLMVGLGIMNFTKPEMMQQRSQIWRWFFSLNTALFWILIIFSWLAFGLSYAAHNVVEDSCMALEEYQENPYTNALGSLLPCLDMKTGNDSVRKIREGMYRLIIQANRNITKLRTTLDANGDSRVNQIPQICNPFSGPPHYKLTGHCLEGTVTIGSVPQALQPFRCSQNDENYCVAAEGGHIPNTIYRTIQAYSTAAQNLIDATPSLESLTNCSFVVRAFSVIVHDNCGPLNLVLHFIWASFAALSTIGSALLLVYVKELHRQLKVL